MCKSVNNVALNNFNYSSFFAVIYLRTIITFGTYFIKSKRICDNILFLEISKLMIMIHEWQ